MRGVTPAKPAWNDRGEAYIADFDDNYFSTEDGAAESQHVFFDGNNLHERFLSQGNNSVSVLADIGFGTGLNAAVILQKRKELLAAGHDVPWLTYLAIDKHPLQLDDLQRAHQRFPAYGDEFAAIDKVYPELVQGYHARFISDYRCRIVFIWDDVCAALREFEGRVDAWLLDGFKPSTNTQMWSQDLYTLMAERSHAETTFATYSVAGHVRRGLSAAGFSVLKRPGLWP